MVAELVLKNPLQWNEHAAQHNQQVINEIISDWNCTDLEAWASLVFDTTTLDETQDTIAQHVTYNRLMKALPFGNERFLHEEYYNGKPEADCDEFIRSEAISMAEELAWDVLYDVGLADDYDEMTEVEKQWLCMGQHREVRYDQPP